MDNVVPYSCIFECAWTIPLKQILIPFYHCSSVAPLLLQIRSVFQLIVECMCTQFHNIMID
jgi:hypothetical protein